MNPGASRSAATRVPKPSCATTAARVWAGFKLEHMLLQLKRPPEAEQSLDEYIEGLTDKTSPNYRKWLTATQLGDQYGVSDADIESITHWLESHGITVNLRLPEPHGHRHLGHRSCNCAKLSESKFISWMSNGETHFANVNDPQIPAALAPAITGIVSIHDFKPHTMFKPRTEFTFANANCGGTCFAVTPGGPRRHLQPESAIQPGPLGPGPDDRSDRRYERLRGRRLDHVPLHVSVSQATRPEVSRKSTRIPAATAPIPGANADDGEAILDAEYASAAAPNAAIQLASCMNTDDFRRPDRLAKSAERRQPSLDRQHQLWLLRSRRTAQPRTPPTTPRIRQAATAGVSVFVSSGDESAASCDANAASATHGIGVSGFASTPYNVSVGGTDFIDTFNNQTSTYWSATNSSTFESARRLHSGNSLERFLRQRADRHFRDWLGHRPPAPADSATTPAQGHRPAHHGLGQRRPQRLRHWRRSSPPASVGGTCAGYAKPSWQSGLFGNPNDGVRDLPDVSLFSANGIWGHFFVFCYSDTAGKAASHARVLRVAGAAAGGTSFRRRRSWRRSSRS